MKKNKINQRLERGQIIPIVVFALIALIGMSTLILDGGALMVNRRAAQNAADAGALAGARVLCRGDNPTTTDVCNEVYQYTTVENNAVLLDCDLTNENVGVDGLVKGEVVVTTEVQHESFFAKIFTQEPLTAGATAAAGCFPYQASVVLPIAYPCRPPAEGSVSTECDFIPIHWNDIAGLLPTGYDPLVGNPTSTQAKQFSEDLYDHFNTDVGDDGELYNGSIFVVVDTALICGEDLICDLASDPANPAEEVDVRYQLNSSQRGWLNLAGEAPSKANMADWIMNGIEEVSVHTWLSFITGVVTDTYRDLDTRLDEIVWIPIFNYLCDYEPYPGSDCWEEAHQPPFYSPTCDTSKIFQNQYPVAHVIAFAPFMPTCVYVNGKAVYSGTSYNEKCPGFELAQLKNPDTKPPSYSTIPNNTNAFEGYFIDPLTLPGDFVTSGGADLGIYTVSLTR